MREIEKSLAGAELYKLFSLPPAQVQCKWSVELAYTWLNRDYLSLPLSQLLSSIECTNLYHRVVSLTSEQDICACFWHSSVAAVFSLYSRHVAAHELQSCPINQPNSHWWCRLLLRIHLPRATQTSEDSWSQLPRANMQVEAGIAHPGSTWTTGQACRDGIRKINAQVELKLKFPLELRNVKGSKGFTGTAATKGRPKTEWAHCWTGMVREKWWNAQKNVRYLMPSLPHLLRSPLQSPTLLRLCSGERNTARVRQIRDKEQVQAGQYMHLWFTRAGQCHSFLEFSSKWTSCPGTARKQMPQSLNCPCENHVAIPPQSNFQISEGQEGVWEKPPWI